VQQADDRIWTKRFVLLILCNFLMFLIVHITGVTLPAYAKEAFGSDDFMIGILSMVVGLSAFAARIFVPMLIPRIRFMLFLSAGLAAMLLATFGLYFSSSILFLILLRVGFGMGLGVTSTLIPTAVSHSIAARRMGEGMGYFGLSNSLASSLGPLFGFFLLGQFGYMSYVSVCLLCLLLIIPLLIQIGPISIREKPADEDAGAGRTADAGKTGNSGKRFDSILIIPSVLNFLFMISFGGLITFLAVYGAEIGVENTGLFFLIQALMALMARPISGKLFDRLGHKAVIPPGACLILTGMLALSWASSPALFLLSAVLYGAGYGTLQPSFQAWMITLVMPESRSMANSMFLNSLDLGIALGSLLLGAVAMQTGYAQMYRFCAWLMAAFLFIYFLAACSRRYDPAARARWRAESAAGSDAGIKG